MDAAIISIGAELTTGQQVDSNAAWIASRLNQIGVRPRLHITVDDDLTDIRNAITRALADTDIVILTGGLGPTPDDLTRQGLADAIGRPLQEDVKALKEIQTRFDRWEKTMTASNATQAMIPRGCDMISNPSGTAPGICCEISGKQLFALPGVPSEMMGMFDASVASVLTGGQGGTRVSQGMLRCFGVSEAKIGDLLADKMVPGRNPTVGITASRGVITVRAVARGISEAEAKNRLVEDLAVIRDRLGRAVYGTDDETLESVVARLLVAGGKTIATVESCTGGLLAKRLTDVPGSSAYFLQGYITYANEAKCRLVGVAPELIEAHGAVSQEVARAMASGCRTASGASLAVSVTGIAGPTGGNPPEKPVGLVHMGLADETGVAVKRVRLGAHHDRELIRDLACSAALNWLRHALTGRERESKSG
jgi:nicotinamide-nucleotide amidase